MSCFYALNVAIAIGLLVPATMPLVQFMSSGWFQGVALPLIGVSAGIAANEVMALIRETHDAVMEMHRDHQREIAALHEKHDALHEKHDALADKLSCS